MNLFKKSQVATTLFATLFLSVSPLLAAAPDGAGPWADNVLTFSQGLMKNGGAVPAIRSNPSATLGVAEDGTLDQNSFSLGFGGTISLGFDNGISNGSMIVEATNPDYPQEMARIEMSEDGVNWVTAGTVIQDGTVEQPENVQCAKYVRITDISDPNIFPDEIADGYDVDGVQALGESCNPATPTPSATPSPSTPPSNGGSTSVGCTPRSVSTTPTILEITRVSPTSIFVSWGPDAGYNTFVVQYGFENGVWPFSTNVTGFSTTINSLPANQPIWVRVAATDNCATTGSFSGPVFSGGPSTSTLVPGFPDTGNLIPGLPNTGFGKDNTNKVLGVLSIISLGLGIYFYARKQKVFSNK